MSILKNLLFYFANFCATAMSKIPQTWKKFDIIYHNSHISTQIFKLSYNFVKFFKILFIAAGHP